jgi:hypothetical protein
MENNTPAYDPNALRPYIVLGPKAGQRVELHAKSSYDAQEQGAKLLKVKKSWQVSVYLADVVHNHSILGS